jgi:nitroreductase
MDFQTVIKLRESVRSYDPNRPIDKEILLRIVEAGRIAPSAANLQPCKFILVSTNEFLNKIRACYPREWFCDAPHILIVKGNKKLSWKRSPDGYNSIETDMTIAMDHMILAAENEGIGTCWIANFNPVILRDALQLNEDEYVFAITPLGYQKSGFKKRGNKQRKPLDEILQLM